MRVSEVVARRFATERLIERIAESRLPTNHGVFTAIGYRRKFDHQTEYLALSYGESAAPPYVAVFQECVPGHALGSLGCRCSGDVHQAMAQIVECGRGVLVYVRSTTPQAFNEGPCTPLSAADQHVARQIIQSRRARHHAEPRDQSPPEIMRSVRSSRPPPPAANAGRCA